MKNFEYEKRLLEEGDHLQKIANMSIEHVKDISVTRPRLRRPSVVLFTHPPINTGIISEVIKEKSNRTKLRIEQINIITGYNIKYLRYLSGLEPKPVIILDKNIFKEVCDGKMVEEVGTRKEHRISDGNGEPVTVFLSSVQPPSHHIPQSHRIN